MLLIRNTLLWALAAATLYAAVIQIFQPTFHKAPSAALTNRLFVENYVYGTPAPNIIAGSSMSQRMPAGALGPGFTNLALSGGNALTGLAIAIRSPATPRHIFIEINRLSDAADDTLLRQTFDEPAFSLRRYIFALRKSYQPLSVLYGVLRGSEREAPEPDLTESQRAGLIADTAAKLQRPIPNDALARHMDELRALITQAEERGIRPVFFEMPIEPVLSQSAQLVQLRAAVRTASPRACHLNIMIPGGAHTNDGIHLQIRDAREAAHAFRDFSGCPR
ncbi:MAG TPA: hypothetical protein VFQ69_11155 [Rhizomicrobium sp.]|nr:hypothetical protein [Rhizomicrobium sp.]